MKSSNAIRAVAFSLVFVLACQTGGGGLLPGGTPRDADDLLVVDCLLPGQIMRLGQQASYVRARQPVRTTAWDCRIRGGEYVAFDRASYATALKVWLPQAEAGDADAQAHVGEIYERGLGLEPDYAAAAAWYRRAVAADPPNTRAMINLGHLYEKGLGVEQSTVEAMNWYRKASGLPVVIDDGTLSNQRTRIAQLEAEVERLKGELDEASKRIRQESKAIETEREAVAAARVVVKKKRDQAQITTPEQLRAEEAALAERAARLSSRESELDRLRDRVASLSRTSADQQRELGRAQRTITTQPATSTQTTGLAGPTIELIEPPMIATRGLRVAVRAALVSREIIGRVTSPVGMRSLEVNARPVEIGKGGVFRTAIHLEGDRTPVTVVAADRRGKSAKLRFELEREMGGAPSPSRKELDLSRRYEGVAFGNYHALIIGNNNYQHLPNLSTAIDDARTVEKVLRQQYGFRTTVLENASRYQILTAMNELRERLSAEDNLLLYYAGHGELDTVNMRGHWLPVDAEEGNAANWISNVSITDMLNIIDAKQIMLVVDACYSGALTRSGLARQPETSDEDERVRWLTSVAKKRSRTVLTSGGLKPVMDVGGGNHSIFAKALLDVLRANGDVLEGQRLYREVAARVTFAASKARFDQIPEYAPIAHAGHESGDFLLVPGG